MLNFFLKFQIFFRICHLFELFELFSQFHIIIVQLLTFKTDLQCLQLLRCKFCSQCLGWKVVCKVLLRYWTLLTVVLQKENSFIIYVVTLLFTLNFSICKQSISKWISKYAAAWRWLDWTSSKQHLTWKIKEFLILIQNNSEAMLQLSKRRINCAAVTAAHSLLLQLIPVKTQINWVYCVFLPLTELSSLGCRLFFSSLCDWSSERKSPKLTKFSMLLIATFLMFLLKSFNRLVAIEFQSSSLSPRSSSMHALNRNIIINKYESKFPSPAREHETRDNSYKWSSKNFRNSWRWRFNKNS